MKIFPFWLRNCNLHRVAKNCLWQRIVAKNCLWHVYCFWLKVYNIWNFCMVTCSILSLWKPNFIRFSQCKLCFKCNSTAVKVFNRPIAQSANRAVGQFTYHLCRSVSLNKYLDYVIWSLSQVFVSRYSDTLWVVCKRGDFALGVRSMDRVGRDKQTSYQQSYNKRIPKKVIRHGGYAVTILSSIKCN